MTYTPESMNVVDGNLLILASAGSGKTYQLGNRVIGRVARGAAPERVVALTFTRKAAGEFADSVLGKLAAAAVDPETARHLARDLGGAPEGGFEPVLRTIIRSLPRFTLTTIDSFFTRIVRGFQYELGLTGGRFDLLEGPRAAAARDELLADILGRALDEGRVAEFARAFRRATAGREGAGVGRSLGGFIDEWHGRYRAGGPCRWGPDFLDTAEPGEWQARRHELADAAREACAGIEEKRKGQIDQVMKFIDRVEGYEVAAGTFPAGSKVADALLEATASGATGDLELQYYKPFVLPAPALEAISRLTWLAARAEMAAAVARTRAIEAVVAGYDELAASRLRRRGLLGFDDVKQLMGEWSRREDARVRRELVDFRLDARYDHWLLDEFQDTSREEWTGLVPLLDEAVAEGDGSLFIVGDRKQAIYGWRGGDVSLFDEVRARFGGGITTRPMAESWRSCPEVLALVNRVCGDAATIRDMFGIGPERWEWHPHESAPPLKAPEKAGEACVELLELTDPGSPGDTIGEEADATTDDPRLLRMIERMRELDVGEKDLACGVLIRRNQDGRLVADVLRAAGFDVVLDGVREPARDHPAGVAAWQLLCWMANPDDGYARRVVEMSPLGAHLRPPGGNGPSWFSIWERLHADARSRGFAPLVADLFAAPATRVSNYGRRRLGEIFDALAAFDAGPETGAAAAARWIERLEVPQNPGAAAVQVMTVHKSKGLGFDVVFLPMLPDRRIPEASRFTMARGDGWLCGVPPAWARPFFPAIREAEEQWAAAEAYEALCQLYVAITRAKRGIYIYLGKKKSASADAPTLTNWILRSLGAESAPGVLFQTGDPAWPATLPPRAAGIRAASRPAPGRAVPRRARRTPSAAAHAAEAPPFAATARASLDGMRFGGEVHACFERIEWLDGPPPELPDSKAGRLVASLLAEPAVAALLTRPPGHVTLLREQALDAVTGRRWTTGVADRMHIHRDGPGGRVTRVAIIDFKTDAVPDAATLRARHTAQMREYRAIAATLFTGAEITTTLLSTALRAPVTVEAGPGVP